MWDEAVIEDVTPFKYKVKFNDEHWCYNREINKEDADTFITSIDKIPRWHETLKQGDTVAYYHETYGWCISEIMMECEC